MTAQKQTSLEHVTIQNAEYFISLQKACQTAGPSVEHLPCVSRSVKPEQTTMFVKTYGEVHIAVKVVLYSVRINLSPFTKGCRECITLMRLNEFLQGTCLNPFTPIIKLQALAMMIIHYMKFTMNIECGPIVACQVLSREFQDMSTETQEDAVKSFSVS